TAYLGFAGRVGKGRLDLPIAIDCCKLRGNDCKHDYCETIATPPMACPLTESLGHQPPATVSCLDFAPSADQNACWTLYSPDVSSVGASDVKDMVGTGYQQEV